MSTLSVHRIENVQDFDFANTPFVTAFNAANGAYAVSNSALATANAFANTANAGYVTANASYGFANSVNTFAYGVALNAASAFAAANNITPQIAPSYNTANSAFNTANAAYGAANNVGPQIAPTFNTANAAYNTANAVFNQSNVVFGTVNAAYNEANAVYAVSNASYNFANAAYASINSNWTVTNTVYGVSNSAFGVANTALQTSGGTVTGTLNIVGDLVVSGNVKQISSNTLSISDPLIYLAGNNYSSDIVDIGFVANYVNATSSNVHTGLFRSSGTKEYYLFQGYDKEPINNYIDPTGNNISMAILNSTVRTSNLILGGANAINWITAAYTAANNVSTQIAPSYNTANSAYNTANAAYGAANNVSTQIAPSYNTANAAYGKANTGLQNTSMTIAGDIKIAGNFAVNNFIEFDTTIGYNYTITTGRNAFTAGPVSIANGNTVTIPSGSYWTVT